MILQNRELIEEGAGFGVPVAKYEDNTLFSSTAKIYLEEPRKGNSLVLKKVFFLDAVSKKQVRGKSVNDAFYEVLHETFERAYLQRQSMRPVFDWTMRLRKTLGVTTQFARVRPRGAIAVIYRCLPNLVDVTVDLSALKKTGAQEILLLNEQGASTFRRYSDTNGAILYDRQIGAWKNVTAKRAVFSDINRQISFSLENKPEASLIRGREEVKDRFSWAGMTHVLNPTVTHFGYKITIQRII